MGGQKTLVEAPKQRKYDMNSGTTRINDQKKLQGKQSVSSVEKDGR